VQSPAVVVAGATAEAKDAVVGELLGSGKPVLHVPDESYLVIQHGERRTARAFLPGSRKPYPYPASIPGVDRPAESPPRPPRRVELSLPVPLLTSFALVDTPAQGPFGPAYDRIVLDAAARGGALLFTLDAQVPPGQAELDFLVAAGECAANLFLAFWVGTAPGDDPATRMDMYRDAVECRVPGYAEAPWFPVAPGSGAPDLRQALLDWSATKTAAGSGIAQAAGNTAHSSDRTGGTARRRVLTAVDGRESGWEELLGEVVGTAQQAVRQALTVELAGIHQRCGQDIVFGGGCAGMPAALDREMHALSLRGAEQVDTAITEITRRVLAHVLAEAPHDDVLRRVAGALRQRAEEDGPDLPRVLLVTSTSGAVAAVSGGPAASGLAAYQTSTWPGVLPPVGIGVSASCYKRWRDEKADADAARGWLQDAVRGIERELHRVLAERFAVVQQVLTGLIGDAVDHGQLLV
jgi:hypothetical protein